MGWIEFEEGKEYICHAKYYHSFVTINKCSIKEQQFGPKKVITIPEGFVGVFENEGKMDIYKAGFYKLPATYSIKDAVPIKTFTMVIPDQNERCTYKSKDGAEMALESYIIWQVNDPKATALYPKGFKELVKDI